MSCSIKGWTFSKTSDNPGRLYEQGIASGSLTVTSRDWDLWDRKTEKWFPEKWPMYSTDSLWFSDRSIYRIIYPCIYICQRHNRSYGWKLYSTKWLPMANIFTGIPRNAIPRSWTATSVSSPGPMPSISSPRTAACAPRASHGTRWRRAVGNGHWWQGRRELWKDDGIFF